MAGPTVSGSSGAGRNIDERSAMTRTAAVSLLLAALAATSAPAVAGPCFAVIDRNEEVIYQSMLPPVDLSDAGRGAREAMRQRGELLLNFESERCIERVPTTSSGKAFATVDEIVMGYKGTVARPTTGVTGAAAPGGAPAAAAGAPARASGSGGGMTTGYR